MIVGLGTDIVETKRIAAVLANSPEIFGARILNDAERQIAAARHQAVDFYAGRWAAKEALSKALGCGIGQYCSWQDITILNHESGAAYITLSGAAARRLEQIGGKKIHLSISHEKNYASATVIIEA